MEKSSLENVSPHRYRQKDKKIIKILEILYENSKCAVRIDGKLTEWFSVLVGVRQGCLLSPTLFNIFLEFVINEVESISNHFDMRAEEFSLSIKYADDSTLLTLDLDKLQVATLELQQSCLKWGMKINFDKCKVLTRSNDNIQKENFWKMSTTLYILEVQYQILPKILKEE